MGLPQHPSAAAATTTNQLTFDPNASLKPFESSFCTEAPLTSGRHLHLCPQDHQLIESITHALQKNIDFVAPMTTMDDNPTINLYAWDLPAPAPPNAVPVSFRIETAFQLLERIASKRVGICE